METIIGNWKVVAMRTCDDNGKLIWGNRAYFEAQEENDAVKMFDVISRFAEDGKCQQLMELPEGVTPEMVAEEGMEMLDGMMVIESSDWKEEDGKLWLDSGEYREVCGEELSSFDEIKFEGETMVLPSLKLERI